VTEKDSFLRNVAIEFEGKEEKKKRQNKKKRIFRLATQNA